MLCTMKESVLIYGSCIRLGLECVVPVRKERTKKSRRAYAGRPSAKGVLIGLVRGRVDQLESGYVAMPLVIRIKAGLANQVIPWFLQC